MDVQFQISAPCAGGNHVNFRMRRIAPLPQKDYDVVLIRQDFLDDPDSDEPPRYPGFIERGLSYVRAQVRLNNWTFNQMRTALNNVTVKL